jgi:hypothetical protein
MDARCAHCVTARLVDKPYLVDMTKRRADQIGGADYTFDRTGTVNLMRQALHLRSPTDSQQQGP